MVLKIIFINNGVQILKISKLFIIVMIICFTHSISACESNSKQELVVGIMPDFDSIPFVVAKQQGYLPANIRLDLYKSPVDRDSALFSGNMDGTISDILAAGIARQGKVDLYITSKTDGSYGLLSSEKITAKDLEGREVGLSLNTVIEYVTDAIITESGGDPDRVKKTAVPKIPTRLELITNKQIDAIAVPEPYVTAAVAAGANLISISQDLKINPGVMLFYGSAIENKPAELKALYTAYNKAIDYIRKTEKADFMPQVIEELGLPEAAMSANLPPYTYEEQPTREEFDRAMDWLIKKGLIEQAFSYDDLIYEIK